MIIPKRIETIRSFQANNGRIAAVLPIRYPRPLLRAFNLLPVEVWGPPNVEPSTGTAHLQPYVCSIVRNALSFLLSGGLEITDCIIVPHGCDSLQGFGSLLIDFIKPTQPVFPLYIPREQREADIIFLSAELQHLFHKLEQCTSLSPTHEELMNHIIMEETANQLLVDLHRKRERISLTQLEYYRLLRSREYLPVEQFIEIASSLPQQQIEHSIPQKKRIVLSGVLSEPMRLFEMLEQLDCIVVGDDFTCCGRRIYPPGESQDPFRRMAESILRAPPDPMHGASIGERVDYLLQLVAQTSAQGIIFYLVKFCEPELFQLPGLRKSLQDAGVRSTVIEFDMNDALSQQTQTRLEAFLEGIA